MSDFMSVFGLSVVQLMFLFFFFFFFFSFFFFFFFFFFSSGCQSLPRGVCFHVHRNDFKSTLVISKSKGASEILQDIHAYLFESDLQM